MSQYKILNYQKLVKLDHALSEKSADLTLYGLVDHAGLPGLLGRLDEADIARTSIFVGRGEQEAWQVAPILFPINLKEVSSEQQQVLTWMCGQGQFSSCLMLLASPLALDPLALRLGRRLDGMLPDDMAVMLRFFDPRVFEALIKVLLPAQLTTFLGVAQHWWFVDRRGRLHMVEADFAEQDPFVAPLQLDNAQQAAMIDASEPDQVMQMLSEGVPGGFANLRPTDRYDFVLEYMEAAHENNIVATHELALFCALAMLYGEDFALKPQWRTVLLQVKDGKLSLQQAIDVVESHY